VPDFYAVARPTVTVEPKPQEFSDSEFQMGEVIKRNYRSLNTFVFPGTTGSGISAAVELGSYPDSSGPAGTSMYCLTYDIVLIRTAGTTNATFAVLWTSDPTNIDISGDPLALDLAVNGHAISIVSWQDDQNSGINTVHLQGSHTNFGEGYDANDGVLRYIKICPLGTPPLTGSEWQFFIATQLLPARNNQAASAPMDVTDSYYLYATDVISQTGLPVDIITQEVPVSVSLDFSTLASPLPISLATSTLSSPLEVTVENESINVDVVEPTPFHVVVDSIETPITITGEIAVIGTSDQTLPIWVTQYGPP